MLNQNVHNIILLRRTYVRMHTTYSGNAIFLILACTVYILPIPVLNNIRRHVGMYRCMCVGVHIGT